MTGQRRTTMSVIILSKQERNEYETNRLVESFAEKGITARACHPDKFDIIVDRDIRQGIKYEGKPIELPDLVLVRLGAGILPFQLAVIRHFEQAGVLCVNSSTAVETVKAVEALAYLVTIESAVRVVVIEVVV